MQYLINYYQVAHPNWPTSVVKIDLTIFNLTFQGSPAACHCPEGAQAPQGSQLQIFLQRWTNWVDSKKDISYFRRPHKRVVFEGAHQAR